MRKVKLKADKLWPLDLRLRFMIPGVLLGFTMIIAGGMIYVLWRTQDLLMFSWFRSLHLDGAVSTLRDIVRPFADAMPTWFYYCLPNAMWLFGGLIILSLVWGKHKVLAASWCSLFALIALGGELGQLVGWLPGTFDYSDVASMSLAAFVAFPVYLKLQKGG
jgi:hypothetical protein